MDDDKYVSHAIGPIATDRFSYYGGFKNGEPHGYGRATIVNGECYEGKFRNGEFDGRGVYTESTGWRHVGEFRNGRLEGHGVQTGQDGRRGYEGGFRNGKVDGDGVYTTASGMQLHGVWQDGLLQGRGRLTAPSGNFVEVVSIGEGSFLGVVRLKDLSNDFPRHCCKICMGDFVDSDDIACTN